MDNLLIIGAGQYGTMIKESARALNIYDKIDFLDDNSDEAIGKIDEYPKFFKEYPCALVAIGNADIRLSYSDKLKTAGYMIESFISRRAYVSPSAKIAEGCVIEPMAVVSTSVKIGRCTIISSGAVVNHNSTVGEGCHINCNATVKSNSNVPARTKVNYGEIF
ncbi:MAG: hypothetical protein IJ746_01795 [Ruminococcus sp.]|nr:hypothetical protein [Ruminococcus sp.]